MTEFRERLFQIENTLKEVAVENDKQNVLLIRIQADNNQQKIDTEEILHIIRPAIQTFIVIGRVGRFLGAGMMLIAKCAAAAGAVWALITALRGGNPPSIKDIHLQ